MKNLALLAATSLILTSCASIFGKTDYPVTLTSNPSGSKVTITDEEGKKFFEGVTPTQATLKSGKSYFNKLEYAIDFEKDGYDKKTINVAGELNPWYFGNIVFGGLIGMIIVDPLTGSMFKIKQEVIDAQLDKNLAFNEKRVYLLSEIPENLKQYLVKVN